MDSARIRQKTKLTACLILLVTLGTSCTYQRQFKSKPIGMPEEIYIDPSFQQYYKPNIVLCHFREPDYSPQTGEKAAQFLYSEMLRSNLEADITVSSKRISNDPDLLVRFAKENRYEFIVTGEILYYLYGGISSESRVDQSIKVYRVTGKNLQMVVYAKAVETAPPLPSTDYVLIQGRGRAAPSAESLLKRNAVKFSRLLSHMVESGASKLVFDLQTD